jgi:arylsulfatase A-like enzyme
VTPSTEAVVTGIRFSAKEKFFKVVNVLEEDWDEELQMVTPEAVNRKFLAELDAHPEKRFIVHYLQPHYPYINLSRTEPDARIKKKPIDRPEKGLGEFLNSIGLNVRTIKRLLGRPSDQMGYIMNKYGVARLRDEYEENLVWVLEGVSKIITAVKGKVVITSDHGEMLGEHGKLGHEPYLPKYKELTDIPYLEVER